MLSLGSHDKVQSALAVSTSLISNNRLSRIENFVPVLTWKSNSMLPADWKLGGRGFNPRRGRQHSFVEIDHEIFSTVILSLLLIQEGQLSVSG